MPHAPSRPEPVRARGALSLAVDSRLCDVALAGPAVRAASESAGLSADAASDLELALVELLNNIVVHGHAGQAGHLTHVEISVLADAVRIRIRDSGRPIPAAVLATASAAPEPIDPADLAALPESGMGLRLVRSCVDELAYEARSGGNVTTLGKYFPDGHRAGR